MRHPSAAAATALPAIPPARHDRIELTPICGTAYAMLSTHERRCFHALLVHAHGQPTVGVFFRPFAEIAQLLHVTPKVLARLADRPRLLRGSDTGALPVFFHVKRGGERHNLFTPLPGRPCWYVPVLLEARASQRPTHDAPLGVLSQLKATHDVRAA